MRSWLFAPIALLIGISAQADLEFLRLTKTQQARAQQILEGTQCTCGCGMTVGQCLIEDQSCPVSPGIAKTILVNVANNGFAAPRRNQTSSLQSDRGEWNQAISGKLLVYVNTTGSSRTKECTWLYGDGSFRTNSQGGSVSSLGTSASSGGASGSWGTQGSVLTLNHPDGQQEVYTMSYGSDGSFYLDHWRYFLVEHDNYACQ